jgi:hypothetical protein
MRCRKLYSVGGRFRHRTAISGGVYESQLESRFLRASKKILGVIPAYRELCAAMEQRYFKPFYRGHMTRTYHRLLANVYRFTTTESELSELLRVIDDKKLSE